MNEEKLAKKEVIVRICPVTKKPVLAVCFEDGEVLDLHNDTVEEDIKKVNEYLGKFLA